MIRPRTMARRAALQYLFMCDLNADWQAASLPPAADFLAEYTSGIDAAFAEELIARTLAAVPRLDAWIGQGATNWPVARLAGVERAVLRLAATEFLWGALERKIVINEAIGLAKKFGGKDSGRFVNGVLECLSQTPPPMDVDEKEFVAD